MSAFGFNATGRRTALDVISRAFRYKKPHVATPPSWFQRYALMYAQYAPQRSDNLAHLLPSSSSSPLPSQASTATSLPKHKQFHVVQKTLFSTILQKKVRFNVSVEALREIERRGGLDEYLLLTPDHLLGGPQSVGVLFKRQLETALKQRNEKMNLSSVESGSSGWWWKDKIFVAAKDLHVTTRKALNPEFWEGLVKASPPSQ